MSILKYAMSCLVLSVVLFFNKSNMIYICNGNVRVMKIDHLSFGSSHTVWAGLKLLRKCVEKSYVSPAHFFQLSLCLLLSSSQPAAPDMLFMPASEKQPQQKVSGSLNAQEGITQPRREVKKGSQVYDESPVLKEKLLWFSVVAPIFWKRSWLMTCLCRTCTQPL